MGSIEKRVEALERRMGPPEPVRIVVVYEDAPREPLYIVTLGPSEDAPVGERGDGWGARGRMGSMNRRIRRLEERMDTTDYDGEARRRDKVLAELAEFEARMRNMGKQGKKNWRNSPEGQAAIRELEEAIGRKRRGA